MRRLVAASLRTLVLVAGLCLGQIPQLPAGRSHYLEIKLPPEVISESIFIRYLLSGEEFGGWVRPRPGVSSYVLSTTREGRPATRIKALLYAPACAIQTLDLPLSGSNNQQYSFICRPLSSVWIAGALTRTDRLYGREVKPQAAPDHAGELQIWARDKSRDDIVAQLIPAGPQVIKARMGGLKILSEYPSETVFAPCAVNPPQLHDAIGFALRPDSFDACDR